MQNVIEARQLAKYLLECATERELTKVEYVQLLDICILLLKDLHDTMDSIYSQTEESVV